MRIIYHHTLSRYRDICFRTSTSRYYTSTSAVRSFSTHTANVDVDSNKQLPSNNNRVPIALYRQLLAWSRRYRDVPFTNPIPPVTLQGPQVNPIALKRLNDMRTFLTPMIRKDAMKITGKDIEETIWKKVGSHPSNYALYNKDIEIKDDMIIFFPSWFEHSVQSSRSDEPRISIAFNIMSSYK